MKLVLCSEGFHTPNTVEACVRLVGKPQDQISIGIINEAYAVEEGDKRWVLDNLNSVANNFSGEIDIINLLALSIQEVAKYLVDAKVKMVGVDTCSVDNQDGFPIHKILLAGKVLIIENLTNLNQLTGKDFKVYALPLNLQIDGSPARVIAEIK
jgi:hypothetical protein